MKKFTSLKKSHRDIITAASWAVYVLFVIIWGVAKNDALAGIAFVFFIAAIVLTVYALKANKTEAKSESDAKISAAVEKTKRLFSANSSVATTNDAPLISVLPTCSQRNENDKIEITVKRDKGLSLLNLLDDYIVLDIETTGLNPNFDRIIEIAAIKVKRGEIIDTFSSLINPKRKIDKFIIELTGITNEMLASAPFIESVLPQFSEFVGASIVVGHNVNFDINFIYESYMRKQNKPFTNDFVDTLRISRALFSKFENYKLCTLLTKFNIDVEQEHRALADCKSTYKCYEYMKKYVSENKNEVPNNIVIGIAPDCLPDSHYPYALQIAKTLKDAGADIEHLRFSFDDERLDVNVFYKAFRIVIKKKGVYICGVGDCEDFKTLYPNVEIKELKSEYRIPIVSPDDIKQYSDILFDWYKIAYDNIASFSKYYPELHNKRLNNYIKDRQQYKIVS